MGGNDPERWIAARMGKFESSGIRKVFDLARQLKDPVNLSIGQPDFPVPAPCRQAAIRAIEAGHNSYTVTQGLASLRDRLGRQVSARFPLHSDRKLLVTSGTSGALVLALMTVLDPGDEVLACDPWFVMYPNLPLLAGGVMKALPTGPDFMPEPDQVEQAIGPRTKALIINSPANPTGAIMPASLMERLARLCAKRGILLISDEIYSLFSFDGPHRSPAEFNEQALVIDGFSKTYAMTGWRVGYIHGPSRLIEEMTKLQQYTFVCAPSMAQHGALEALDLDMSAIVTDYGRKRDYMRERLEKYYDIGPPGGAFYIYPKAPRGMKGSDFVAMAIANNLLIIPGNVFSASDTHFRLSYAVADRELERGADLLVKLARD
jgi:aspartate aminotransferase/aminotransferase